jgi:hypothetical protein
MEPIEALRQIYERLFPDHGLWEVIARQLPGLGRPTLDTPTGGATVRCHLDLARDKAQSPPRIALVGPFSCGKSTLLNAILHSPSAEALFRDHLGLERPQKLLPVGEQVTTGNLTEVVMTGAQGLDAEADDDVAHRNGSTGPPEPFMFEVQYLSEAELGGLFAYFNEKLALGLSAAQLRGDGWVDRLPSLELVLQAAFRRDESPEVRHNLRVLQELVGSLQKPACRAALGQHELLGTGRTGLSRFRDLLQRPKLDVAPTWEANRDRLYLGRFHLVKFLRVRLPHPDFRGLKCSLFDFPGLGGGLHRDEYISRDFLAEANVIMVLFKPGQVGGAVVHHILEAFATKRAAFRAEALLDRIYFLQNGMPLNAPTEPTLVDFYLAVLQAAKQHLGPILERTQVVEESERRRLLVKGLRHFLACHAPAAVFLRDNDKSDTAIAELNNYQHRADTGMFRCPTDPETLRELAQSPRLHSATEGYPLLATALTDATVAAAIADICQPLEEQAGLPNLLERVQQFVLRDGPRIQAEDVREHLRAAARPLAPLTDLRRRPAVDGGQDEAACDARGSFEAGRRFEQRWAEVLSVWLGEEPFTPKGDRDDDYRAAHAALVAAEDDLERRVRERADQLVNRETFDRFRRVLEIPDGGFSHWLLHLTDQTEDDFFGSSDDPQQGLLRLDHTLVLYRYYLDCRDRMMAFLYDDLMKGFLDSVRRTYLSTAGKVWEDFNQVWVRMTLFAEQKQDALDEAIDALRKSLKGSSEAFFRSAATLAGSASWGPAWYLANLLPPRAEGAGDFFDKRLLPNQKLRLRTWLPREPLPSTGQQLAIWLVRMKLWDGISTNEIRRRQVPALPTFERAQVVRVLQAVGLLDPGAAETDLTFADPADDFWNLPLPCLHGRCTQADGTVFWNPVPFDLYGGRFDHPSATPEGAREPLWQTRLRSYLVEVFSGLAVRVARVWKKDCYLHYQNQLLKKLLGPLETPDHVVWRWLNEHGARLCGEDPLTNKLRLLHEALDDVRRADLLPDPARG